MLKFRTIETLSHLTVDAVQECILGVDDPAVKGDTEMQALRVQQLEAAKALRTAFNALSALKSEEFNLGVRRAINGV